jgi:hypothetical protein
VAAQDGLQVLGGAEAAPEPAAVAEDDREEPEDALHPWLVGERGPELGEVDLPLAAGGRLEAALEGLRLGRTRLAQEVGQHAVAALVAELADLAQQALAGQLRPGGDPLAQVVLVGRDPARARRAWPVDRGLHPALEVPAHGLAVEPDLAGDGRDGEPLPLQVVDQDDLPQCDHLHAPAVRRGQGGHVGRRQLPGACPRKLNPAVLKTGEFSFGTFGEDTIGAHRSGG